MVMAPWSSWFRLLGLKEGLKRGGVRLGLALLLL
jgi:hypothetical protein